MTRSLCTSCGLRSRYCQCHLQNSTAPNANANSDNGERAFKLTPASFCVFYLLYTLAMFGFFLILYMGAVFPDYILKGVCNLEVFADSFSISNASNANATADWNVGFTTRNPGNGCKVSLRTIKSRLLRGNKLLSESSTPDYFGLLVTGKLNDVPVPYAVFKTVATPRKGVVWDIRVEVVTSVKINGRAGHGDGFLIVTCRDIPVNFTADPTGNVNGSLIGYMRPCEYLVQEEYTDPSF
ncbi:unnamed protein product [Arabidopsis lyrata]|uniref:Late embryogenesis abundant protein LEA-2 subgroup domain-containing protein n=1 Tax=Arabidopsis lyrata subsp. lyrata TaxID=81972 RepID=D7M0U8_ARALL|nr:uncharacterized protein LOC9310121 [Arabidopsis lyrata subsp. lyrata]EFH48250.1 hypothetical protein ARALYDRAFT_910206 [Arabidopsis lyrata subsp. lyrata]CAH8271841.1 unnamed protein product [Arabidopsis lyrata]|eukprot:XP_002871991.1 uncharacterized protein LOC9310121 [Arabidopsis lyrata subsp. lyrata]